MTPATETLRSTATDLEPQPSEIPVPGAKFVQPGYYTAAELARVFPDCLMVLPTEEDIEAMHEEMQQRIFKGELEWKDEKGVWE